MSAQASSRPGRGKRGLMLAVKVLVSAGMVGFLVHRSDAQELLRLLWGLHWTFVLFAWVFYAFCQLLSAWRWQLLLDAKGLRVPLWRLLNFYMVGMFLNNFIPGAVGGDVVKSIDLYRYTGHAHAAVVSVFLERFTGLIGLCILSVVAVGLVPGVLDSPIVIGAVGGTAVLMVGTTAVIWHPTLFRLTFGALAGVMPTALAGKARTLFDTIHSYRNERRTLALTIGLSVLIQFLFAVYYALTARVLGVPAELLHFVLFLPTVTIVTMLPLSLGGLGLREAAMVVLFGAVGLTSAQVLSVSLTVYVLNTLLSLWGAIVLLSRKQTGLPGAAPGARRGSAAPSRADAGAELP